MSAPARCRVLLTTAPLDLPAATAFAAGSAGDVGAVSSFLGLTRCEGGAVVSLFYEAHPRLALGELHRLVRVHAAGVASVYIAHRLGEVAVGEASILIVVGAAHRAAALSAVAALIDSVKASVPVWKAEVGADGVRAWRANAEAGRGDGGVAPPHPGELALDREVDAAVAECTPGLTSLAVVEWSVGERVLEAVPREGGGPLRLLFTPSCVVVDGAPPCDSLSTALLASIPSFRAWHAAALTAKLSAFV